MIVDTWKYLVAQREAYLARAEEFTESQWDTRSLCEGWRVRDVTAHMIVPERFSVLGMIPPMVKAGFSLDRLLFQDAVRRGSVPIPDLLDAYRQGISRRGLPPGRTVEHLTTDLVIHMLDVFHPLGMTHVYPPELLILAATTICGDKGLGGVRRTAGLHLTATDVDWSTGQGHEVTGPAEVLILAAAGRRVALDDLTGPGVEILASRRS